MGGGGEGGGGIKEKKREERENMVMDLVEVMKGEGVGWVGAQDIENTTSPNQASNLSTEKIRVNPPSPRHPRAIVASAKIRSDPSHPCPCFRFHPLPSITWRQGEGGVGEKKRMVSWGLMVMERKRKRMGKDVRERKRMAIAKIWWGQVGTREWGISWVVAGS